MKGLTDSEQRSDGDRTARLNLLPMPGRESKRNHIFLGVTAFLPDRLDSLPERLEELLLPCHTLACKVSQAKTPRAE
jgi:hypothetical protein